MSVALVIPVYNEEKNIIGVIESSLALVDWLIIVDDGSSDQTEFLCQKKNGGKVVLLRHKVNLGKGAALNTVCWAAKKLGADIIVTIDGDGQHDVSLLPLMVDFLLTKNLEFVFTVRQGGDPTPLIRFLGNKVLNLTARWLFRLNIRDIWCGFRIFRSDCLSKISWNKSDYSGEIQMALKVGRNNLAYGEYIIPVIYDDRVKGVHIVHGLKLLIQMIVWRIMF
jgi:glycosyltransferase involved in cell wall biosynthesis